MISRITSTIQAAADVVAPPCERIDDFKYHWMQVLRDCQKCQREETGQLIPSEETRIPRHLQLMLKVLIKDAEESLGGGQTLTPCLEYVIQEKILVKLVTFSWADRPLGIRQYVFMFLSKILQHLHHSYLHQMRVHRPLQGMIKATCEKKASPYENQEIEFLSIICEKIRQDHSILLLYIEPLTLTEQESSGFTPSFSGLSTPLTLIPSASDDDISTGSGSTIIPNSLNNSAVKIGSTFPLIEALLNLCHSNDAAICFQAHECLIALTHLQEPRSSTVIAKHSLLAHYIASRLTTVAETIPLDTEPGLIDEINLNERENDSEDDEEYSPDFLGRKEVTEFLRWLVLFDKLIGGCNSVLGSSICSVTRELFFEGFICPHFCSEDEDICSLFTSLLTKVILVASSSALITGLTSWLTADNEFDEVKSVRTILFERCRSPIQHLRIQSLRLLQVMLEKPGSVAVQVLAINYVNSRSYFDSSAAEHQQTTWSDEEDERYKHRDTTVDTSPGTLPVSRTLAPSNINSLVKKFLSLVPEDIKSTSNEDFESYKQDAMRQYRNVCRKIPWHAWPREAATPSGTSFDASSRDSRHSGDSRTESEGAPHFAEGPLLKLLLDSLENLPSQDYDVNLQVTSVVSSLALVPHPNLHEFLLNPTIPLASGVRTPYTVLVSTIQRIRPTILARVDYRNYLKMTRFQLLGTMHELDFDRDENEAHFEALIVADEFIKELAAIAYAKFTCEGNFG